MGDLELAEQGVPTAPGAGFGVPFIHSDTKRWSTRDSTGRVLTAPALTAHNTADEVASAADTYLAGSKIAIPSHKLQVGAVYRVRMFLSKTAAGIVAPVWVVRLGTLGTTGDAIRLTFTGVAQTAAIDNGYVEINAIVRSIGASGVIAGGLCLQKTAVTAVGLTNTVGGLTLQNTSVAFDTTTPTFIGVSVNPGASGVWTHQVVFSDLLGM
jgi:hypothetical protein